MPEEITKTSDLILVSIHPTHLAQLYREKSDRRQVLQTNRLWGFLPDGAQIPFSIRTRPWLLPERIVDASNNILVRNECDDSSEISLLPMFLLTSVMKNSMLPMNSDQQTY